MTRRRDEASRARKLRADSDAFAEDFRLRELQECDRFGRYYLRGRHSWAEVITARGCVIVCGDVTTVRFAWLSGPQRPRAAIYWMSTDDYSYATQKASIGDSQARVFDSDVARSRVLWWRRMNYLTKEQARTIWDSMGDEDDARAFYELVWEETEDCEFASNCEVTAPAVFTAQAILRRLVAELEARDFRESSLEWFRRAA